MELTVEQIIEAIKKTPALITGILPTIQESDVFKTLFENKVKIEVDAKIGEKVSEIHSKYDDDIYAVLGVRAGSNDKGKQKTYELAKELFSELATLRSQKDSLSKDAKVKELNEMIEKLKSEGGAKHVQEVFDKAKETWETEKTELTEKLTKAEQASVEFKKRSKINEAKSQIKFNEDTPESIKKMVLDNIETLMLQNSKFENEELIFLGPDGKPEIDTTTYKPKTALEYMMSQSAIKDIVTTEKKPGGGAQEVITGSIIKTTIEGKDSERLNLTGTFKSKTEFQSVAEKSLIDSGITRNDEKFTQLMDKAYVEYKVADLPAVTE